MFRTQFGERIEEDHAINLIENAGTTIVVDSYFNPFNGLPLSDLTGGRQIRFRHGLTTKDYDPTGQEIAGIIRNSKFPNVFLPIGKKEFREFSVARRDGKVINFSVEGRSQAERKFKQEDEAIAAAGPDHSVTIEWVFNPFYTPLGHTTLRIGKRLYEFARSGWGAHNGNKDSARAFLFNNPFFKRQYERHRINGMPPFSIAMVDLPVGSNRAYSGFSSVMTFRKLLLEPTVTTGKPVIYTLSGVEVPQKPFREMMPKYLYEQHSSLAEFLRVLRDASSLFQNN